MVVAVEDMPVLVVRIVIAVAPGRMLPKSSALVEDCTTVEAARDMLALTGDMVEVESISFSVAYVAQGNSAALVHTAVFVGRHNSNIRMVSFAPVVLHRRAPSWS